MVCVFLLTVSFYNTYENESNHLNFFNFTEETYATNEFNIIYSTARLLSRLFVLIQHTF